jgi:hypothetical protein
MHIPYLGGTVYTFLCERQCVQCVQYGSMHSYRLGVICQINRTMASQLIVVVDILKE